MDSLTTEKELETKLETKIETATEPETLPKATTEKEFLTKPKEKDAEPKKEMLANSDYLNSFENLTVADIKREEEKKKEEEFKAEKERLIEAQYAPSQDETTTEEVVKEEKVKSENIIEKPNYDFLDDNKKIVKLKKSAPQKKLKKKKLAGIVLACTLFASATICVANCVIIDNMNAQYLQIEDQYKLNLGKYLNNINNLDATKKSMEMIETYPEDLLDAGDVGEKSNWFDRLCGFLGGLFGG